MLLIIIFRRPTLYTPSAAIIDSCSFLRESPSRVVIPSMVTKNIQENTIDSMQTIVEDRSKLIENYVHETESYLTAYSRAGEIKQLLLNPADEDAVVSAQKYTEVYSSDIEHLEGIYVSEWDAHVLAHTNAAACAFLFQF